MADNTLPPIKAFTAAKPAATQRSNSDMAQDFLDLAFSLESGRNLSHFTRFDTPIRVKVQGRNTATLRSDLKQLLGRLRAEAGLDILQVSQGSAQITIHSVAKKDIRQALPHAACFVVPNVDSLSDYRRSKNAPKTDWIALKKRKKLAIFLPFDTSPQDVRDCLHEELAQALGPLNDLYRLNDSVFNDDNFHTVLTSFDMLMLRVHYDPRLQNGMSREAVAQRLPEIFARLNPKGASNATAHVSPTPREWINSIQYALGPSTPNARRLSEAQNAIDLAKQYGWSDHRRGFSHYALARLLKRRHPDLSYAHYLWADKFFGQSAAQGPHRPQVAAELAAFAIANGDATSALSLIQANLPAAHKFENAVLLSSLLLLKSEALAMMGEMGAAQQAHLDSLGWARYGFGPEWAVRAKQREVAALNPHNRSF
ncbi:DUF2927 domain-containing protein [Cognatishimia sp. WU-CL00825]